MPVFFQCCTDCHYQVRCFHVTKLLAIAFISRTSLAFFKDCFSPSIFGLYSTAVRQNQTLLADDAPKQHLQQFAPSDTIIHFPVGRQVSNASTTQCQDRESNYIYWPVANRVTLSQHLPSDAFLHHSEIQAIAIKWKFSQSVVLTLFNMLTFQRTKKAPQESWYERGQEEQHTKYCGFFV